MNISQTTLRIGAVLGTIGAIVVLAASAQAATSKPAGMSQPEYLIAKAATAGLPAVSPALAGDLAHVRAPSPRQG